jgi:hypothetical protein
LVQPALSRISIPCSSLLHCCIDARETLSGKFIYPLW